MNSGERDASAVFVALANEVDKDIVLVDIISELREGNARPGLFQVSGPDFRQIPASPFAYWTTNTMRETFQQLPPLGNTSRSVKQGLATADDFRFLRAWWEVGPETIESGLVWHPYAKGGAFSTYFSDLHLLVNWANNGKAIKENVVERYPYLGGNWGWVVKNSEAYFRPGLTWSRRSQRGFSIRALSSGSIFADKGPAVFVLEDDTAELLSLLALMNSVTFRQLLELQMAFGSFEAGVIQRTPVPYLEPSQKRKMAARGQEAHDLQRQRDFGDEITHVFSLPSLVAAWHGSIAASMECTEREFVVRDERLEAIQSEIDAEVAALYGLAPAETASTSHSVAVEADVEGKDAEGEGDDSSDGDQVGQIEQLLQWVLGCVLGRWDVRMARDFALVPKLQGPFEPLPVCAPGALVGPDGLPARLGGIASEAWLRARTSVIALPPEASVAEPTISDAVYPLRIDWDGILVDDEGHPDDVVGRVREVLGLLWEDRAEAIEQEARSILGVANLREYFHNPRRFWEFHVKRYSKSRRKAPIYWLLQSSKRSYGLWLYYHRMDADILYKALRNYVDPKIARERHRLEELEAGRATAEAAGGQTRREHERLIDRQQSLLTELEGFRQTLEQVALLDLTVDHDDGVILSIAPLHELVPWKPATQAWNELVAGKYEWSTMATRMREKGLVRGSGRQ